MRRKLNKRNAITQPQEIDHAGEKKNAMNDTSNHRKKVYAWLSPLAGNFKDRSIFRLTPSAEARVRESFQDIPAAALRDYHAHIMGLGEGGTGCYVNASVRKGLHPLDNLRLKVFLNSGGIQDKSKTDRQFVERLLDLTSDFPDRSKFCLLAFDQHYKKDGTVHKNNSKIYVPNDYVYQLSEQHPDVFIPSVSVHPYRQDALSELEKWASKGIRQVKWLPNAMGMDPSDELCVPFYQKMKDLNMVLLAHTGKEQSIKVTGYEKLGNPLLYRKALDIGVKVIMAHCSTLGMDIDLDSKLKKPTQSYQLFLRLMDEKKYEGILFGDISAITQFNRAGKPLLAIMERTDIHHRLLNGSDYPLPAVNAIIWTRYFRRKGYITKEERDDLNQIYKYNPLLFDYVLKRTIRHPKKRMKFSPGVFIKNDEIGY